MDRNQLEIKYYRDLLKEKKKCFIPYCVNNNPKKDSDVLVRIKDDLKEEWFRLVGLEKCPKRAQYCCQNHLILHEDLENYERWVLTKQQHPVMKPKTRLKNYERETEAVTGYEDVKCSVAGSTTPMIVQNQVSRGVQVSYLSEDKGIQVMPATAQKSTNFIGRKTCITCWPPAAVIVDSIDEVGIESSQSSEPASELILSQSSSGISRSETNTLGRDHVLSLIRKDPKLYLGIPKKFFWIIEYLSNLYNMQTLYIIITLFKIKNNDCFTRLSGLFQISIKSIHNKFPNCIKLLASFFQNLVFIPTREQILRNLPLVFRIRYSKVQVIIDCLEIEIEKPSNPTKQAQTWSNYKSCNTVKYLIGCTPNGFVVFVSKGFGGRVSDKAITLASSFIDILPPNCTIMADRGFKEIESALAAKNIKLLRPPSVFKGQKLTKQEVISGKVIASLRVHVERLIRRLREFHILKPHSTINYRHTSYLDEFMIIACGLINLQKPLIREY